jgi:pectinesterase inhibitor-like protein
MLLQTEANTEFIKTSCNATSYPALCFSSLSAYASAIKASPLNLASTALNVTIASARSTTTAMTHMYSAPSMDPYDRDALRDCMDTLGDAVDELKQSAKTISHLGSKETGYQINSVQTWVSAALTDDNTCMDGFRASGGDVRKEMRSHVLNVAQLTSNALDLINGLSKTIIHSLPWNQLCNYIYVRFFARNM